MGTIGKSLRESLKKLAYSTSVDQLKKRGVKKVNVLGLDRITSLIEESVMRSLRNSLIGLDREQVAGATSKEFLRLLKSNEDLQRSADEAMRQKQHAEEEVDDLRRTLEAHKNALRERLAEGEQDFRAHYEGENSEIIEKLNAVFVELADQPSAEPTELRDRMLELVMDIVGREREATVRAKQAVKDREVDTLERRISKLTKSLSETEQRLAHVASLKNVDDGISSIYREVQGLNQEDDRYERKKELMESIFTANIALQKGQGAAT